jgi:hypothetical protein
LKVLSILSFMIVCYIGNLNIFDESNLSKF